MRVPLNQTRKTERDVISISDSDCTRRTPAAGKQRIIVDNDDKRYELEPQTREVKGDEEVFRQTSMIYSELLSLWALPIVRYSRN
jgi:hypothetical protein